MRFVNSYMAVTANGNVSSYPDEEKKMTMFKNVFCY